MLLVIDGMGEALLRQAGQGTQLLAHRIGRLTSVFPSTTAAAVTTLLTGLAPAQHGLTGWHMYLAEAGSVLAVLPLLRRVVRPCEHEWPAVPPPKHLFDHRGLFGSLERRSHVVSPEAIADSAFNRFHTRGAQVARLCRARRDVRLHRRDRALRCRAAICPCLLRRPRFAVASRRRLRRGGGRRTARTRCRVRTTARTASRQRHGRPRYCRSRLHRFAGGARHRSRRTPRTVCDAGAAAVR